MNLLELLIYDWHWYDIFLFQNLEDCLVDSLIVAIIVEVAHLRNLA